MNRLSIASFTLLLGATAWAQTTTYKSSPSGYLSTEGEAKCYILGEWSAARTMFFDGEMRGSPMLIKETAHRHDEQNYTSTVGMGRSWSNVTLDISEMDYAKQSVTFSANPTSTPVRVFSSSVTWPTISGFPTSKPAAFAIRFPFSGTWFYNGTSDICLDYDFNGGVMANNAKWATNWYWTYYLDAPSAGDSVTGTWTKVGTGCVDSGNSSNAYTFVSSFVYNSKYSSNTAYRDMYRVYTRSGWTALNQPVIHAIGINGNTTGINFPGMTCDKIYVDLNQFYVLLNLTASNTGDGRVYSPDILFPYTKAAEGVNIWAQCAFDDSVTKSIKVGYAEYTTLPKYPAQLKRTCIWQTDGTLKYLNASPNGNLAGQSLDPTHNPVIRYAQ